MKKNNIIYFVADQMRQDALHHTGNDAAVTPHLDALAKEGVSFVHAYCQNPVCVPSRCSFLTGLYPHTTGHRTMHYLQDEQEWNILNVMKDNGYEVIWCGRNDIIPADRDKSAYCDEYYNGIVMENLVSKEFTFPFNMPKKEDTDTCEDGYYSFYLGETKQGSFPDMDENCVSSAIAYVKRRQTKQHDKPFFLYVTLGNPHPPYGCPKPYYGTTDRSKLLPRRTDISSLSYKASMLYSIHEKQHLKHWDEERWNELRATYLDMVHYFDHQFGRLKEALVETDIDKDTSIFVFSDHGDYTGDYGIVEKVQNCFEDPVCNVPLIIRPAKEIPVQPRITPALAELVDLSATVADLAGITLRETQFGTSLLPVVAGSDHHKDAVYCEGGRLHGEEHCMEKGHDQTSPYWPRLSTQAMEGPQHTKAIMMRENRYKYIKRLYELDELYDLETDPMELHNLVLDPVYEEIKKECQLKLLDFLIETGDRVPNRKDKR